jgi:hypothetical protein
VYEGGKQDISGTVAAEISASLTTRAYRFDNNSHVSRRMYVDISTWRPNFTVTAFVDGANEYSTEITNQTYSRSRSWLFNDSTYDATNANDDYNRAFREDYSTTPSSVQPRSGFLPEVTQAYRLPLVTRRKGRLSWLTFSTTTGYVVMNGAGFESRSGDRSNLTQVG